RPRTGRRVAAGAGAAAALAAAHRVPARLRGLFLPRDRRGGRLHGGRGAEDVVPRHPPPGRAHALTPRPRMSRPPFPTTTAELPPVRRAICTLFAGAALRRLVRTSKRRTSHE